MNCSIKLHFLQHIMLKNTIFSFYLLGIKLKIYIKN